MWKFFPAEVTPSRFFFIHEVIAKQQEQIKLLNNVEIKKKKSQEYVSQSATLQYGTNVENVVTSWIR